MIVKLAAAVLLLAGLAAAAPAEARQRRTDPNCSDDRGVDRCDAAQQARTRQLYGVRSIEEHRAAGDEVRRIFYVDGYGRDTVAIAFVRSPGRDPTLWVHHPQREGEPRTEPFQAPVPQAVWDDVIERSRNFHRRFDDEPRPARPRRGEEEVITLCLHSSVWVMEAVDRPFGSEEAPIRREVEDACEDGAGEAYATQLDRIARALIPHCAALDITHHRTDASALSDCRLLGGDRLAAAEVLNLAQRIADVSTAEDGRMISHLFDYDAIVDWGGEQHRGAGGAGEFWAARIPIEERQAVFYFDAVFGMNANLVRLTGSLWRISSPSTAERDAYETATVEQVWARSNGGEWQIQRATVGHWRPEAAAN